MKKVLYALIEYDGNTNKPVRVHFTYTDFSTENVYRSRYLVEDQKFTRALKRARNYLRRCNV